LLVSYRELKHKCLLSRTEVTECKLKELHKRTGASCVSAAGKRSRGPHCLGRGGGYQQRFRSYQDISREICRILHFTNSRLFESHFVS